jgi:hypothetical protein
MTQSFHNTFSLLKDSVNEREKLLLEQYVEKQMRYIGYKPASFKPTSRECVGKSTGLRVKRGRYEGQISCLTLRNFYEP